MLSCDKGVIDIGYSVLEDTGIIHKNPNVVFLFCDTNWNMKSLTKWSE